MKPIITVTALLLLFSFQTFSQDKSNKRELLERFTIEILKEIHKSNVDALEGLNDNKYWLLNSKNTLLEQVLRNQQGGFYIEEGFNIKDSRTAIKKTLLNNGFLLLEFIVQEWDGSAWVNSGKTSYTYDGNNNLIDILSQIWDGSAWVNSFKSSFTYDGNNLLTEVLFQIWDGTAWMNSAKSFYTYDGNNVLTEVLSQSWEGSAWVNSFKSSYTYDGNNNLSEILTQFWDGSAWVNSEKSSGTYDGNNNLTEVLFQSWDGSAWVNASKWIYLYTPTGIGQLEGEVNTYSLSNNYPNPFNPGTKIVFQIPEGEFVTLKVYDILGNEIVSLLNEEKGAGKYEVEFNAANLPSGIYFYRLKAGSFVETKKMVFMK